MTRWRANPPECEVEEWVSPGKERGHYGIVGPTEMAADATANMLMDKLDAKFVTHLGKTHLRVDGKWSTFVYYIRKDDPNAKLKFPWGASGMYAEDKPSGKGKEKGQTSSKPTTLPGSVAVHMATRKVRQAQLDMILQPARKPAAQPAAAAPARSAPAPRKTETARKTATVRKTPEPARKRPEPARTAAPRVRGTPERVSRAAPKAAQPRAVPKVRGTPPLARGKGRKARSR